MRLCLAHQIDHRPMQRCGAEVGGGSVPRARKAQPECEQQPEGESDVAGLPRGGGGGGGEG
jgi:hypothetical protein